MSTVFDRLNIIMIVKKYYVSEPEVNKSEPQQEAKVPALNVPSSDIELSVPPVNYEPNQDDYDLTRLFEMEAKGNATIHDA